MTEAYHPHSESPKEKDEEKEKKDHKKHAAKAHLGKAAAHKHVSHERPHKPDEGPSRPPAVEAPKHVAPETTPTDRDEHVTTAEEATWPAEFKKLHDEIVASVSKEDDDGSEKPNKPVAAQEGTEAETAEGKQTTEAEEVGEAPDQTESVLPENTHAPEVAELAAMGLPEQIVSAKEAESGTEEPMAELPAIGLPESAAADLSGHETPVPVTAHEQESTEPSSDLPLGDPEPLISPTMLEQFGYGDSDTEPWGQPAGGLANPKVLEKLDSIDKRERLNDAYHGSREAGLGAVVGLVGLGLILEHFAAKRRDKKLKRQIDTQGRQLKKTNQAAQLEQRSGQTSSRKLEGIEAAQAAKSEHARTITSAIQSAEAAAAATVAVTEQGKTGISSVQEKVLAERLTASKELGQAIRQNPELKDITDSQELVRSLAVAEADAAKQERQIDGLQREVSYEKLRGSQADNKGPSNTGGGGVDTHGMPVLPTPQQQLPAGIQADLMLDEHALISKSGKRPSSAIVPVAAVTVLLILAAVILIVFAKL